MSLEPVIPVRSIRTCHTTARGMDVPFLELDLARVRTRLRGDQFFQVAYGMAFEQL